MKFADYLLQENRHSDDIVKYKKMLRDNFDGYMSYFRGLGMFYYDVTKEREKKNATMFDEIWDNIINTAHSKVEKQLADSNKVVKKDSDEYKVILHDALHSLMDIKRHVK